jgi:hypothetical protein
MNVKWMNKQINEWIEQMKWKKEWKNENSEQTD